MFRDIARLFVFLLRLTGFFWLVCAAVAAALGYLVYRMAGGQLGRLRINRQQVLWQWRPDRENPLRPRAATLTPEKPRCPHCGAALHDDDLLCPRCHGDLKENCSACGKVVQVNWGYCPHCGAATASQPRG